jgi:hypothetical protein
MDTDLWPWDAGADPQAPPTVVLNEKLSLVGAVPAERCRMLIDWILAGEPGGGIPLAAEAGAVAGRSPVA